jgi:MFS family permease
VSFRNLITQGNNLSTMQQSYHHNIYYLYIIKLSKWLMLIMPIVALFYNDNGLTDFDIFLLQAIYSISVALLEIPSGYMADIVGRKKSLILGSILGTLGYVVYSFSATFSGFLSAEIILGLGGSLISGADSALLFDSLAATGRQHRYLQFEGRITSLGNFAETGAAICGGVIAAFLSYRAVYISQAAIAALAIPASLLLLEPKRDKHHGRPGFSHIISVCSNAVFTNKQLSSSIYLSAITGVATLCMAWTAQIYFVNQGLNEIAITPLWVTLNLTVAIVAAFTAKAVKILGNSTALLLIVFYIPITYILLGWLPLVPALFSLYLFYSVRGFATPLLKNFINQNCDSSIRATVLSIRNLFVRFGFALLGPSIGWMSINSSLSSGLILAGLILLFFSSIAAFRLYKFLPVNFQNR